MRLIDCITGRGRRHAARRPDADIARTTRSTLLARWRFAYRAYRLHKIIRCMGKTPARLRQASKQVCMTT
ncbi:hypothetical protein KCP77_01280 [Salmonella enterica subsp. enterica]|nr:hypothetical protein KCP77_01280 [Salmonella enterica subsp. enterica]